MLVDGRPVSASLFDLALYLRWNGRESVARGSGPYVYLAKLESRHEAELWNDVFVAAQEAVGLPRGTIRATVLIETITASFEMEEILFALREHSAGLNAGRWDYIFSAIKKFRDDPAFVLPDRAAVTMAVPFMHAYTEQLVRACHRRGAHAIGGMAAFIPSRDAAFNEQAFARVREDKEREAGQGFDGTWVAHPGLVPLAREIFDAVLGDRPNQKARLREDVVPDAAALLALDRTPGEITLAGVQTNVSVGLRYLDSWLGGVGAAAIDNLMEDAATAEISRAQLWQWIRHACRTSEGEVDHRRALRARARRRPGAPAGDEHPHLAEAAARARRARAGHRLRALPDAARRRAAAIAGEPEPVMRRLRAYLRFDRRESRLPASIATLVSAVLYLLLPEQLSLGPGVVFPIVAVLGVLPLTIADALGRSHPWQRPLALTLLGLTAAANGASLALLVRELIARNSHMSGRQLLAGALTVWRRQRDRVRALVLGARPRRAAPPRGRRRRHAGLPVPADDRRQGADARLAAGVLRLPLHLEHERDGLQPDRHDAHHRQGQAADVGAVALVVRARRARHRARRQHPPLSDPGRAITTSAPGRER